ncbi:MAG TPA: ABC transporter ATP-binding protein [Gammaproteobacteria bacterium]|nr:ABC transporter ATP-binding protein [Gammaproteobacteria bacterium]
MIEVDGLTRRYGDFTAVDQLSFSISQGEIVGLLGHNGAGKTTIMKMLTGYLEPSAGEIRVDGLDIRTQREAIQRNIGYLPENCPVYPEMTVVDYLDYAAALHGVPEDQRPARLRRAIARTELEDRADQPIATLSRGLRQRVGVAQAILHEPAILILDEPTNGLDPTQILHMRELIRDLARNATVIISTHILQEVQAVCDRVIIIRAGRKALDSTLMDLRRDGRLLLEVDAGPQRLQPLLSGIPALAGIHFLGEEDGHYRYAVSLQEDGDGQAAPRIAEAVVQAGLQLHALQRESRDLETVFGEITAAGGEVAHG